MKMPIAVAMVAHLEIQRRLEARGIQRFFEKRFRELLGRARFYAGLLPVYRSFPLQPLTLFVTSWSGRSRA
ncbi:hypothetical protein X773_13010 [Mesorhizobium sp. LSJC285A00]|nr:hypothetical protein X773_13010 [Mesorhizobium sp. LSJC285A00]